MTSSPISPNELAACSHAILAESTKKYWWSRIAQVVTFLLSVATFFIPHQSIAYLLTLGALVAQLAAWMLRMNAGRARSIGDEGRMRSVLIDAFGFATEKLDLSNLVGRISPRIRELAVRQADPDYYASVLPSGAARLRQHLEENCFWNKHLYGATARSYMRFLLVSVVVAATILLIAFPFISQGQSLIVSKVIVSILSFGAAWTQVGEILAWRSAAEKSDALDRRLGVLASFPESELRATQLPVLLAVFGDYCVATSSAPPIPPFVYNKERSRLNDLWTGRT